MCRHAKLGTDDDIRVVVCGAKRGLAARVPPSALRELLRVLMGAGMVGGLAKWPTWWVKGRAVPLQLSMMPLGEVKRGALTWLPDWSVGSPLGYGTAQGWSSRTWAVVGLMMHGWRGRSW